MTCGGGIKTRNRTCHFGEAGIDCIGSPSQSQECNTQQCGKFLLYNTESPKWSAGLALSYTPSGLALCFSIQILPTGYVGLILRSTAVTIASRSTVEGTVRVLRRYCDKRLRSYCVQ